MKKNLSYCLIVILSFSFYQCNNSDIVNSEKLHIETFSAVMNSNTTFAENKRARAEANKLIFYDNDFLQTKEPMSDNAIAPFDYKTGLVGNKAYNIKVYTTALERVKRNLSVKDNQLIIKAKSGKELNMAEDLFSYISELMCTWNKLIKEGEFDIVNIGDSYYSIEPNIKSLKSTRTEPINFARIGSQGERWRIVKSIVDSEPVETYLGEHFVLNFGQEIAGQYRISGKVRRYYICNACMVHGINDPACVYNYIATSVIVPDADVYVCSLRNVSHLAIITYQQEK